MNTSSERNLTATSAPRSRVHFELIFAGAWLGFGLFVLPALIYAVGVAALGAYGENQGLGSFYADFFRDLAEPSGRSWAIALGPFVIISLVRLAFLGARTETTPENDAAHKPPPGSPSEQSRVEPRIGLD